MLSRSDWTETLPQRLRHAHEATTSPSAMSLHRNTQCRGSTRVPEQLGTGMQPYHLHLSPCVATGTPRHNKKTEKIFSIVTVFKYCVVSPHVSLIFLTDVPISKLCCTQFYPGRVVEKYHHFSTPSCLSHVSHFTWPFISLLRFLFSPFVLITSPYVSDDRYLPLD